MSVYNTPTSQTPPPNKKDQLLNGLSLTLALYGTIWVAPAFYGFTAPLAQHMILDTYGESFLEVGLVAHGVASAAASYFALRLAIWTAFTSLTMATAKHASGGSGWTDILGALPF
jgi:hypothetical protein